MNIAKISKVHMLVLRRLHSG